MNEKNNISDWDSRFITELPKRMSYLWMLIDCLIFQLYKLKNLWRLATEGSGVYKF